MSGWSPDRGGSIPSRPTIGIKISRHFLYIVNREKLPDRTMLMQNPEHARVVSVDSTSDFQADRTGSSPVTCLLLPGAPGRRDYKTNWRIVIMTRMTKRIRILPKERFTSKRLRWCGTLHLAYIQRLQVRLLPGVLSLCSRTGICTGLRIRVPKGTCGFDSHQRYAGIAERNMRQAQAMRHIWVRAPPVPWNQKGKEV